MALEPGQHGGRVEDVPEAPPNAHAVAPPDAGPSREYRATVTFTVGGVFVLVVAFLLLANLSGAPSAVMLVLLSGFVGAGAMLGAAYGLSSGSPWAIAVATPMLYILIIEGTIEFVVALANSSITIPIAALLSLWALSAPLRSPIDLTGRSREWGPTGTLVVGALVLATAVPLLAPLLLR